MEVFEILRSMMSERRDDDECLGSTGVPTWHLGCQHQRPVVEADAVVPVGWDHEREAQRMMDSIPLVGLLSRYRLSPRSPRITHDRQDDAGELNENQEG